MLGISVATERRIEYSAVTALQDAGQNGSCSAGQGSIPVTVLPAGNGELVTIQGAQPGAAAFLPAARALSAAVTARSNSRARQNKSHQHRRAVAAVAVQRAGVSPLRGPGSGLSGWLIAVLGLLGAIGVVLIGRALPRPRERLAAAGGSAPEAVPAAPGSAPEAAPAAPGSAPEAVPRTSWMDDASEAIPPTPVMIPPQLLGNEVGERPTTEADQAAEAEWLPPTDLDSAAAAWIPGAASDAATEPPAPQPATPQARSHARRPSWLQAQRSHALMAVAVLGGTLRLLRRSRHFRRRRR